MVLGHLLRKYPDANGPCLGHGRAQCPKHGQTHCVRNRRTRNGWSCFEPCFTQIGPCSGPCPKHDSAFARGNVRSTAPGKIRGHAGNLAQRRMRRGLQNMPGFVPNKDTDAPPGHFASQPRKQGRDSAPRRGGSTARNTFLACLLKQRREATRNREHKPRPGHLHGRNGPTRTSAGIRAGSTARNTPGATPRTLPEQQTRRRKEQAGTVAGTLPRTRPEHQPGRA